MPLKNILHALKYKNQKNYGVLLGKLMYPEQKLSNYDLIIPVPLHKTKLKHRGFNQVSIMLKSWDNTTINNNIILRTKDTKTQALSSLDNREENVKNAFILKSNVIGLRILIVDDVITTSSTINEIARILKAAGAIKVDVCALMRAI